MVTARDAHRSLLPPGRRGVAVAETEGRGGGGSNQTSDSSYLPPPARRVEKKNLEGKRQDRRRVGLGRRRDVYFHRGTSSRDQIRDVPQPAEAFDERL